MPRNIFSVVGGIITVIVMVTIVQNVGATIYPPPNDLNLNSAEALEAHLRTLSSGAFLFAVAGMALGSFMGGLVASWIAPQNGYRNAIIVAAFYVVFGIIGMLMISHPIQYWIANFVTYLPCALLGHLALQRAVNKKTQDINF